MATALTASEFVTAAAVRYERKYDLLSPEYEVLDPNPDLHVLFAEYNVMFFDGKLAGCEVKWSSRMTLCAGLCSFQPRSGFCSIRLSEPLLKLRPRSDMINTLLHEMIHAYVFVFSRAKDHDDHGAVFQSHMHRINQTAGTQITVFHSFHDEVDSYRQHWWKCNGPCQRAPPYYGVVKRAMNRPPGPTDRWWDDHQKNCGGSYEKIKDPPGFKEKQEKKLKRQQEAAEKKKKKEVSSVKNFFPVVEGEANGESGGGDDSQVNETQADRKPPVSSSRKGKEKSKTKKKPEEEKKPKAKKPRVGNPATANPSTIRTSDNSASNKVSPRLPLPSLLPLTAGLLSEFSGSPVVFSMGDDEFYLADGIHAIFQTSHTSSTSSSSSNPRIPTTTSSTSSQVVDLTFSDDDDEEAKPEPEPKPAVPSTSRPVTEGSTSTEIIEIED